MLIEALFCVYEEEGWYWMTFQILSSLVILWCYDRHASLTNEICQKKVDIRGMTQEKVTSSLGEQPIF